jgi:hypothetical protein
MLYYCEIREGTPLVRLEPQYFMMLGEVSALAARRWKLVGEAD